MRKDSSHDCYLCSKYSLEKRLRVCQVCGKEDGLVRSTSFDQDEIIDSILKLHSGTLIEVDPTYSQGGFYKNIARPYFCSDLNPQFDFVVKADCRNLPLPDNSFLTVILDGPFGIGSGPSLLKKKKGQNITPGRFGAFKTGKELYDFYRVAIPEMARLKNNETQGSFTAIFSCTRKGEMNLLDFIEKQKAFSEQTFGPGKRTVGICNHIRKELVEVEKAPTDLSEWIDVIILGFDGAWRAGYSAAQIAEALFQKQEINIKRSWPPPKSENEPVEHLK